MATDREQLVIDKARVALEAVIDNLDVVLAQIDHDDAPWPTLLAVLMRERVGRAQAEMRQLLKRVDMVPEPKRDEVKEQSA